MFRIVRIASRAPSILNAGQKAKQPPTAIEMFPSLHKKIEGALSKEGTAIKPKPWFNRAKRDKTRIQCYETYIMGSFKCRNGNCNQKGWGSKKVFTVIQQFPESGYNALVFPQSCRACNTVGMMQIDESTYIDRVTFRLKKWAGIAVKERDHERRPGPPHDKGLNVIAKPANAAFVNAGGHPSEKGRQRGGRGSKI